MINIIDKIDCCGCNACVQACPKQCIDMIGDKEGFLYPQVNQKKCIDCHLCEKVCPVINQCEPRKPLKVFAAKNYNVEVRRQSSSGGIFSSIAEQIIKEDGVVFGACFNEKWEVVHENTETREGIVAFRGSKYVQSQINDSYVKVEFFLKQGRKVLFSGTPCQVAGLRRFLRKDYDNLLTVDFVCHGVPSPKVWQMYLNRKIRERIDMEKKSRNSITENDISISDIFFRNKDLGWKKYCFILNFSITKNNGDVFSVTQSEPYFQNVFMKGFLNNLFIRPSCGFCPCKELKSKSDITIADYWGIENVHGLFYDDLGVSAVLCNTPQSVIMLKDLNVSLQESSEKNFLRSNPALIHSAKIHPKRTHFFNSLSDTNSIDKLIKRELGNESMKKMFVLLRRIVLKIKRTIK